MNPPKDLLARAGKLSAATGNQIGAVEADFLVEKYKTVDGIDNRDVGGPNSAPRAILSKLVRDGVLVERCVRGSDEAEAAREAMKMAPLKRYVLADEPVRDPKVPEHVMHVPVARHEKLDVVGSISGGAPEIMGNPPPPAQSLGRIEVLEDIVRKLDAYTGGWASTDAEEPLRSLVRAIKAKQQPMKALIDDEIARGAAPAVATGSVMHGLLEAEADDAELQRARAIDAAGTRERQPQLVGRIDELEAMLAKLVDYGSKDIGAPAGYGFVRLADVEAARRLLKKP